MVFEAGTDPCPTINWNEDITDEQAEDSLGKLVGYVAGCGYSVEFSHRCHARISHATRTIHIDSSKGLKKMYYVLLHESAHMIINLKNTLPNGDVTPYVFLYPGLSNRKMSAQPLDTNRYMVSLVHEELDAWRKGADLAHVLQLPLDMYRYTQLAYKAVGTYIKAASEYCSEEI